jgi:hypothetical protein
MSYADIVICVGPLPILETWPPIYRGQERTVRDGLRVSQSSPPRLLSIHTLFTWSYLRVHLTPYFPDPKSFILDICRVNPRQSPIVAPYRPRAIKTASLERQMQKLFLQQALQIAWRCKFCWARGILPYPRRYTLGAGCSALHLFTSVQRKTYQESLSQAVPLIAVLAA